MQTPENLKQSTPEYSIQGKELRTKYPKGHYMNTDDYEQIMLCDKELAPGDPKALRLLEVIYESVSLAQQQIEDRIILIGKIKSENRQPTPEEEAKIKNLDDSISINFLYPIRLMNKTENVVIDDFIGRKKDFIKIDQKDIDDDVAYSKDFAYGGLVDPSTGKQFVLLLDSDLKFYYDPNRGIKYRKLHSQQ